MTPLGIDVTDVRASFLWTRCHLDILRNPQAESRLKFLGRRFDYRDAFEVASTPGSGPYGLERPWVVPPGQPFWSHYLEGVLLPNVTATQAWRALVPFRKSLPARITAPGEPRIVLHGFFYPHGVALVIDITHRDDMPLESVVDRLLDLIYEPSLEMELPGLPSETMKLDEVADVLMDALSRELLEGDFAPSVGAGDPFSVVTVVKAEARDDPPSPANSTELRKVLEGLVSWEPQWRKVAPRKLEEASLPLGLAPPDHVLYGAPRGRAVWFPWDFAPSTRPQTALSTLHKDLVLTSLQVESLAGFLATTLQRAPAGNTKLQAVHSDCARAVSGLLGRLYGQSSGSVASILRGGKAGPYASTSPRYQIDQNGYAPAINEMRDRFSMSKLHTPP